jgi:hypothetical protein
MLFYYLTAGTGNITEKHFITHGLYLMFLQMRMTPYMSRNLIIEDQVFIILPHLILKKNWPVQYKEKYSEATSRNNIIIHRGMVT